MSHAARQRQIARAAPQCEVCGAALPVRRTGRPRRYCSDRCRQKGARVRAIVNVMVGIELLKAEFAAETETDWSDESHRVA